MCSPISAFVVRCLDSIISLLAIAEISRLHLVSVPEAGQFEFYLVENPKDRFSRDMAQIIKERIKTGI